MDYDIFGEYSSLFNPGVPDYVFLLSFWITSLIIAVVLIVKKNSDIKRMVMKALLAECIFIMYCSTAISRETFSIAHYNFHPFWSYQAALHGNKIYFVENALNIILFIPIGLLTCGLKKMDKLWKITLFGCLLSCSIEKLQFFLHRGLCEIDDVINNALGTIVEALIYRGFISIFKYRKLSKINQLNRK